jgi:hypothetical protein
MTDMDSAPPLPPLPELRALFHYNPVTGTISYLQQRGPKLAGRPAGTTQQGIPLIRYAGQYHPAAAVAWALYHRRDPSPQHVIPCDGNPLNLALVNLKLSDTKFTRIAKRGRSAKRPARNKREKHLRFSTTLGMWQAWHNHKLLGLFYSKTEASMAKLAAMKQEQELSNA